MQKEEIIAIATKVAEGIATREEMALYINHIDSFVKEYQDWKNIEPAIKMKIEAHLRLSIQSQIQPNPIKRNTYTLWPRVTTIAVAVAAVVFGVWFWYLANIPHHTELVSGAANYANDVPPGKQGATLTLANGRKIRLTDAVKGELAKEVGVVIRKSADGQLVYEVLKRASDNETTSKMNTLATTRGETYHVRLPDGSMVWLNAASSLTYAADLTQGGKRRVILKGEGYFEIAKDKRHPFVVNSGSQQLTVLGTHFNVNGYEDKKIIKTTLLEGSVRINNNTVLKPGQLALNIGGRVKIEQANTELETAWIKNDFYFKGEPLENVMQDIARWYDVEVVYSGKDVKSIPLIGQISRTRTLSAVLNRIAAAGHVQFEIKGKQVSVIAKSNNN